MLHLMKTFPFRLVPLATLCLCLAACAGDQDKQPTRFISIGTGGVSGVYYPVGGAIAKIVNRQEQAYRIRASAEATKGSVYNINAVLSGDLDFGIAQSDRHHQAWQGLGDWEGRKQAELRSVLSLHPEIITLIAAADSGITSVADLQGKRVNLGNHGSGNRGNALDVLLAVGLDPDTAITAESLKAAEAPRMIQDGRIDAFFYTVGHPNGAINEATAGARKVCFVPITDVDSLLDKSPYYTKATIRKDLYPMSTNEGDTDSIGMVTTFVTSTSVPEDVVYAVTKEILTHLEEFKLLHPALSGLNPDSMRQGLTAPLHPGARRCFEELGLL